jgi:hypothetical protein
MDEDENFKLFRWTEVGRRKGLMRTISIIMGVLSYCSLH